MPTTNTEPIKDKIISVLKERGPSLPVHISGKVGQSMLFTSAFLSELLSEGRLKTSNMKVGSSPVYYLPNQKQGLEKYTQYLKSKEKEAYELIKEKKILKDSEQEPAIRVALRSMKDFAISFEKEGEIFWRYFLVSEDELNFKKEENKSSENEESERDNSEKNLEKEEKSENNEKEKIEKKKENEEKNTKSGEELNIFEDNKKEETENKENKSFENEESEKRQSAEDKRKKKKRKNNSSKSSNKSDKFFNSVKEFLKEKGIEISDIEGIGKSDLTLRISENESEKILVAINKKRIDEDDLQKAYKKAQNFDMPFVLLCKGGPLKRLQNTLEAARKLSKIEEMK